MALAVAMGIGRFAFTPLLPMMREDAGVSVAAGGWLASANYLGYLAGALSATRTRLSAPAAIRAGLVTIGGATLAMGLTDAFSLWLLLRAVAGVASAWVLIHVSAWCLERLAPLSRPATSDFRRGLAVPTHSSISSNPFSSHCQYRKDPNSNIPIRQKSVWRSSRWLWR